MASLYRQPWEAIWMNTQSFLYFSENIIELTERENSLGGLSIAQKVPCFYLIGLWCGWTGGIISTKSSADKYKSTREHAFPPSPPPDSSSFGSSQKAQRRTPIAELGRKWRHTKKKKVILGHKGLYRPLFPLWFSFILAPIPMISECRLQPPNLGMKRKKSLYYQLKGWFKIQMLFKNLTFIHIYCVNQFYTYSLLQSCLRLSSWPLAGNTAPGVSSGPTDKGLFTG